MNTLPVILEYIINKNKCLETVKKNYTKTIKKSDFPVSSNQNYLIKSQPKNLNHTFKMKLHTEFDSCQS